MSPTEEVSSIADASRPNAGRIYDYLLGGNHNFEIDRQAAEQLKKMAPFIPQIMRIIRWFLGEAVRRLLDEGFIQFLDFASGLPTMDHIHQVAPKGIKVIYSDIDPVTVAYAQQIIKDDPNSRYEQCDAGKPERLLDSGVVEKLFGNDRKVAIGFNGIAWFLTDDQIAHSMQVLYEWADKGSRLFICDRDTADMSVEAKTILEIYKKMGQPLYDRTQKQLTELFGKWVIEDPGFMLLEEWVDIESKVTEDIKKTWSGGGFYGAILRK